jgi:uncharacterized protein YmfQ (DUF2313 family)
LTASQKIFRITDDQHNAVEIDGACATLRNRSLEQLRRGNFTGAISITLFCRRGRATGTEIQIRETQKQ